MRSETSAGVKLFARVAAGISLKDLRGLVDEGKQTVGSGIVAIAGVSEDGKAGIAVGVTDDLTDAVRRRSNLVRMRAAMAMGGRGRRRAARHGAGRRTGRRKGGGGGRGRGPGHRGECRGGGRRIATAYGTSFDERRSVRISEGTMR